MALFAKRSVLLGNYFSFLLAILPFSFIAGNLIINLNILFLIISALIFFRKDIFFFKYYLLDKVIILFFFFVLITGFYNDISIGIDNDDFYFRGFFYTTIKSVLFFKYLLMYFVIKFLIEKEIINIKYFFFSCAISSIFVCFDIIYQFINGKDIFGYEANRSIRKLAGPFGDELIAGGYIQRFSLFSFFVMPLFLKNNLNKFSYIVVPIMLILFLTGLILSGNRMPFILFLFLFSLIIIFQSQTRKFLFPFLIIASILFFIGIKFNENVRNNFNNFYVQISKMTVVLKDFNLDPDNTPQYFKEFQSFYGPWSSNKFIGGGIKNFRYYCHNPDYKINQSGFICNMHPHNYYLEILTETGLIGLIMLLIIFMQTLYHSFFKKYFTTSKLQNNNLITPFIFLFIVEIFPIKSTGSFFTTGNATYIFLILPILIGLVRKEISIEKKI